MTDDWRLRVVLPEEEQARELADRLARFASEHDLRGSFDDRVIVSRDYAEVFCYADSREQAEAAERAIRSLGDERHWALRSDLRRWHPVAEEWEDPDQPLPSSDREVADEHAHVIQTEREESASQGFPEFEVRIRCPSRSAAAELALRLQAEGIQSVQRWQFVVLGAPDEDTARELAEQVRREAPGGSTVTAEASIAEVAADNPLATPFNNPFSVFGGLGG